MNSEEVLYYVEPQENFEADGRYFFKGVRYPVLRKDKDFVILTAENGAFNFKNPLMDRTVVEWDLLIHETLEGEE